MGWFIKSSNLGIHKAHSLGYVCICTGGASILNNTEQTEVLFVLYSISVGWQCNLYVFHAPLLSVSETSN